MGESAQDKPASELTDRQIETLRNVLEKYRRQLTTPSADVGPDSSGIPFGMERDEEPYALARAEIDVELQEHSQREVELIDAAFKRIELGTYGECCDCGNPIGFERLEAYPVARRCIACKRAREKQ